MAFNVQAPVADVLTAGYVRIGQLAEEVLYLLDNYQPGDQPAYAIIDLRQKLEALAFTTDPAEIATILGDLGETYGIPESVYTDPLLRPVLTIPINGAEVRPLVMGIQGGKVMGIQGGKVMAIRHQLVSLPKSSQIPLPSTPVVAEPVPSYITPRPVVTPYEQRFVNVARVSVQHYLGRLALFQLFDQQGEQFEAAVESSDTQQITLSFSQPISGTIVLY